MLNQLSDRIQSVVACGSPSVHCAEGRKKCFLQILRGRCLKVILHGSDSSLFCLPKRRLGMKSAFSRAHLSCFLVALIPLLGFSQSTQQEYQYDTLGRLIQVKENNIVKVGYCYDKAGNRTNVNTVSGAPEACDNASSVPPKPTGLGQGTHQGGGCYINWSAPTNAGITYFQVRLASNGNILTIAGNLRYFDHNTSCFSWIRACNAQNICSDNANF